MKKWTYLVAAGMMLGATPVFTGCIDNDEPEGITILRGAKAELLKAKASVAAASVEQVKAEAALKLAEAEVKKAEAARIQAIADYEAAKAKEMEYKAELANIQNEEARADLENKIKMYAEQRAAAERAAQEAAAQLEVTLMGLKAQLVQQEALYEQALKDLALAKNTLTEAQNAYLEKWTTALNTAQNEVKQKAATYESAVKELARLTKIMEKTEAKESYLRTQQKAVDDAKADLDAAIEAQKLAEEYTGKTFEAAEKWEEEMLTLEADLKALDKKLADLAAERTKVETATAGEYEAVLKARQTYMDLTGYEWDNDLEDFSVNINQSKEEIKLNDIIISINEPTLGLAIDQTITDKYYDSDYLKALQNGDEFQLNSVSTINSLKETINGCALDPNDKAWTEENVARYTRELEKTQNNKDLIKEQWEQAVKAFKGLEYGNPSSFEGFDIVEEAVAAYNEAIKKYNADVEALNTFRTDKLDKAWNAHQDKLAEIEANYEKAKAANQTELEETYRGIEKNTGALEKAMNVAWANYDKLKTQYDQIENPTADDAKAYKAAEADYNKAVTAYQKAYDEANGYLKDNGDGTTTWIKGSYEKAQILRDNKNTIAEKDKILAEAKETEDYFKVNPNNALENESNKLWNAIYGYEGSFSIKNTAYQNVCQALSDFNNNFGFSTNYTVINEAYNYYDSEKQQFIPQEVKAEDVARINKNDLRSSISNLSRQLYGYTNANRLVELTAEEIKQEIVNEWASMHPDASFVPYDYYSNNYTRYGLVGNIEYYKALIAQGTAALQPETKTKIENLVKEMDTHLADIDAQFTAYIADVIEPAETAYTTAYTTLMDKFTKIDTDIAEAESQKFAKKPVLDKINAAIEVYLSQEMTSEGKPVNSKTLADLREELQSIYEAAVTTAYEKETEYINAKEALQAVIDGTKEPVAAQQEIVADAQKALEAAQAELKAASEALQAEIERISATDAE